MERFRDVSTRNKHGKNHSLFIFATEHLFAQKWGGRLEKVELQSDIFPVSLFCVGTEIGKSERAKIFAQCTTAIASWKNASSSLRRALVLFPIPKWNLCTGTKFSRQKGTYSIMRFRVRALFDTIPEPVP